MRNSITQRINAFNQSQADNLITTSNNITNNNHYQHQQHQQQSSNSIIDDDKLQQTHNFTNLEKKSFKGNDVKANVPIIITTNDCAEQEIISMNDETDSEKVVVKEILKKIDMKNGNGNERVEPVKPEIINVNENENDEENLIDGTGIDDYYLDSNEVEQFSTIKRSPHSKTNSLQSPDEITTATAAIKTTLNLNSNTKRDYESKKIGGKKNIEIEENNEEEDNNEDDDAGLEVVRTKVSVTVQQSQSQIHPSLTGKNNGYFDAVLERSDCKCRIFHSFNKLLSLLIKYMID